MKKLDGSSCRRPHVLIFPFPAQSHVNTTLKLAEHLCLAGGIDVTFLTSDHICNHRLRFTGALRPFDRWSHFKLETITDGLPEDHPRCGNRVTDMFRSVRATTRPAFRYMVVSGRMGPGSGRPPVTCIIADGIMSFAVDVAKEIGVPSILFRTVSASCFWAYFCIPRLIEAGHLPFKGNNSDMPINGIPDMEGFLRRRDIPGFCQCNDLDDVTLRYVINEGQQNFRADAIMFNTFEELESPVLNRIRQNIPQLYLFGPLHARLMPRSSPEAIGKSECMAWLDEQADGSVVYLSFGSVVVMTASQALELWNGLINSGKRFLWAMRPGSISIPDELIEAARDTGLVVKWAPQEAVLGHPAVGAFLTHAGWNSAMESLTAGVPMICWPLYADQFLNARFVSHVWNVGLGLEGSGCDRAAVERAVREVLDERKDEFRGSAEKFKKLAESQWRNESPDGSGTSSNSWSCFERLVQDLRAM
ncbi:hypothetical protein SAY87_023129 [Trapa incisa]|uniref:Glycosyltransferase n=1 Tax=Trapa incisa TaxID=236973 RepID=A0AAN7K8X9_9MYRT|nr:hypothetical protein SAY87_023129 [Trapa incisa]